MAGEQKAGSSLKAYNGTSRIRKVFTGNIKEFKLELRSSQVKLKDDFCRKMRSTL